MKKEKNQQEEMEKEILDPMETIIAPTHNEEGSETIEEIVGQDSTDETQEDRGVVSNCSHLNLREAPSTDAKVLKILSKGTKVKVSKAVNDFYQVTANDISGYCKKQYITIY